MVVDLVQTIVRSTPYTREIDLESHVIKSDNKIATQKGATKQLAYKRITWMQQLPKPQVIETYEGMK